MKKYISLLVILFSILLTSCVNQNTKIITNIMPTTNPCTKLSLLKNAYYSNFEQLKEIQLTSRTSNIWRAKYQLFGQDCQVFSWGGTQQTYSCHLIAPNEQTAKKYYQDAKATTQQCLGDDWSQKEEQRAHDDGLKTVFNNPKDVNEKVTFSTHLVPTSGIFSTTWTIYYYVGNNKQPSSNTQ